MRLTCQCTLTTNIHTSKTCAWLKKINMFYCRVVGAQVVGRDWAVCVMEGIMTCLTSGWLRTKETFLSLTWYICKIKQVETRVWEMFCAPLRQQAQYGLRDCCLTASSPVGIMLLYSSASGNLYLTHPFFPNTMCVKTPWPQPLKMSSLVAGSSRPGPHPTKTPALNEAQSGHLLPQSTGWSAISELLSLCSRTGKAGKAW